MSSSQYNTSDNLSNNESLGKVRTISKSIDSALEPIDILQGLNQQQQINNCILLESSEIESKENVKSILMLQAAIRIECNEHEVKLKSLTANGLNALKAIYSQFKEQDIFCKKQNNNQEILIRYTRNKNTLDEDSRLKKTTSIDALRTIKNTFKQQNTHEYSIFLAGLFAFDLIANFENLPSLAIHQEDCPDYVFYLTESLLVIDHQRQQKRLYCNHFSGTDAQKTYFELARSFEQFETQLTQLKPYEKANHNHQIKDTKVSVDVSNEEYQNIVKKLKQRIIQGDIFQVVPSRTFSLQCMSPINSYRELKRSNPSPYMFYMQDEDFILFGASPESSLKYSHVNNKVELYPIAGTRPRGKNLNNEIDLDLDARIEAELKLDQKEVSEHMMLVDLARNDIARISVPGTTHVPRLLEVDRYSQVMHLVSCVEGQLNTDLDALHAYQACMNMGTLTGAPKIKATELIRQTEGKRRGSYGGAIGYINGNGDMDSCIVIRSAFYKNGVAKIQAGAGIVYDSVPKLETEETENKAAAVIKAIQAANQFSSEDFLSEKILPGSVND